MSHAPLISVIVPVFDVEDHIAACIASLRAQSGVDFEVIVVDDGSTDDSAARARAAMAGDDRFRLVAQNNRGLSGARNTGLGRARGDLIAFVDGDDRVAPDWLWQMQTALEQTGADWVSCAIRFRFDDADTPGHGATHSGIHGAADLSHHVGVRRYPLTDWREVARHFPSAWNKLYRRSLIDGLTFTKGTWFEDHGFYWRAAARTDHIVHLPQPLYVQTRGRAGQITARDDDRVLQQMDVLDDLRGVIDAGDKTHGDAAFARIASRLLFERTTALRDPERRRRYIEKAAQFMRDRGIIFDPDWDDDIARSFGLELDGILPLSVIVPWNGTGDLGATLDALGAQTGPLRDVLVVCDSPVRADAARALTAAHPDTRVQIQTGRGPGAARDHGLSQAQGRFVMFLNAGDRPQPWLLQQMTDALLTHRVPLVVIPSQDAQGAKHAPLHDPGLQPGLLPPDAALSLRPILSAAMFDRAFLHEQSLSFGPAPRAGWRVILAAAGLGSGIYWMDRTAIPLAPQAPRAPRLRRLTRGHDALVRGLPQAVRDRLPDGWRRRLFARALRNALDRAPAQGGRARAQFLAQVELAVLQRGLGGMDIPPAGFDPNVGPRLRRVMDPGGILRDALSRPRATLRGLVRPGDGSGADPAGLIPVPLNGGGATVTVRASFARDDFANLGLLDAEGREVLFHLSLQATRNLAACNDMRDGHWGDPVRVPLDLAGRDAVDITVKLRPPRIDVLVDDVQIFRFGAGIGAVRPRFAALGRIALADLQGGMAAGTLTVRGAAPAPRLGQGLTLRADLVLAARCDTAAPLRLQTGTGVDLPLIAIPDAGGQTVSASLPGRIWRGAGNSVTLHLRDDTGRDVTAPLTLTRADMAARITAKLADPALQRDAATAMLVVEHVRFAGLTAMLDAAPRAALSRLVGIYGLEDFLADGHEVEETKDTAPVLPARAAGSVQVDTAVTQVSRALRADPPPQADAVLAQIALPTEPGRGHLLELCEAFTSGGRDPGPLVRHANRIGLNDFAPGDDLWANSAMLPFLLEQGHTDALHDAIWSLIPPGGPWVTSAPLAWLARRALADTDLGETLREDILYAFMDFTEADADRYWRRSTCAELTRSAVDLVASLDRVADYIRPRALGWAVRVYGLSRSFWRNIDDARTAGATIPSELDPARAAFDTVDEGARALATDGALPAALAGRVHAALRLFETWQTADADRIRRETLGPAGAPLAPGTAPDYAALLTAGRDPGRAALRHMAHPGTAPVTDLKLIAQVARTLPDFSAETSRAPYAALQTDLGRRMARLPDPAPVDRIAAILEDLNLISGHRSGFLGQGLALRLMAMTDADGTALVQDWLADQPARLKGVAAAAVSNALITLQTHQPARAQDAAQALEIASPLPPERQPIAPDAPHPGALHDLVVVVFSCLPNLTTRIPPMRVGWLGQLADKGIPHIIVVGDGDGRQDGDVVHLAAPDDYEGLPQKTLAAIDWVRERTDATHMLKVDDDCFVNVDAFFDSLSYQKFDYYGRKLTRRAGQMDRTWHNAKSQSERGRYQLDRSPEPSTYTDGGTGYVLSRRAMHAARDAADSAEGQRLIAASFMEDKMLGDLLRLRDITPENEDYHVSIRRRTHPQATPVALWVNSFHASRAAPVKLVHLDTHLDQEQALNRLETTELAPKKIWPSYQKIQLGYQSNALELVSPVARIDDLRSAPISVVACMRNEMFMLPRFLEHYRGLGVRSFAIADNLSDDGTLEYLEAQPDVAVFSVDTDYSLSQYGVAWQQALLSAFRLGRWSLVADADELLVWQDPQRQSLPDLLAGPDFEGADAARVFMLDMYPEGPLSDADFRDAGPFAQAGFTDAQPFLVDNPGMGPYSDQPTWTSALRHRLIPGSRPQLFVAQKYALLRYTPWMNLSAGLHYAGGLTPSRRELFFAHFKYNADFRRKAQAEVTRKQHFNDAEEYRKYLALASEGRDVVYEPGLSVPWTDSPFVCARLG